MRQRPIYTRAKEERRQLVSAVGGDELFLVLKMLVESIHRFLHQPFVLDAQHGILVHKFLDDDARPLQHVSGLLLLLRPSGDLRPQQAALGPELRIALILVAG